MVFPVSRRLNLPAIPPTPPAPSPPLPETPQNDFHPPAPPPPSIPSPDALGAPPAPPPAPPAPPAAYVGPSPLRDASSLIFTADGPFVAGLKTMADTPYGTAFLDKYGNAVRGLTPFALVDAFTTVHADDRHAVTYQICKRGVYEDALVRLRKEMVPELVARGTLDSVSDVQGIGIIIDFDNVNAAGEKIPWTEELRAQFTQAIHRASAYLPLLGQPTVFHTTKHGGHLGWLYNRGVPVGGRSGHEDIVRGVLALCRKAGLCVDLACSDWTRLFRLSCVTRDGLVTSDQDYFAMSWGHVSFSQRSLTPPANLLLHNPDIFRPASSLTVEEMKDTEGGQAFLATSSRKWIGATPHDISREFVEVKIDENCPGIDTAVFSRTSPEYKNIESRLKAKGYGKAKGFIPNERAVRSYRVLAQEVTLFDTYGESFHHGLNEFICDIVSVLGPELSASSPTITLKSLYSSIMSSAAKAGIGHNDRTYEAVAEETWRSLVNPVKWAIAGYRTWFRAKEDEESLERDAAQGILRNKEAVRLRVVTQLKEWNTVAGAEIDPLIGQYIDENWQKLLMISDRSSSVHVLRIQTKGMTYGAGTSYEGAVYSEIRDAGHNCIEYFDLNQNGQRVMRPIKHVFSDYGTIAEVVVLSRTAQSCVRLHRKKGYIGVELVLKVHGIKEHIPAVEHPEVDEWLRALGGSCQEKLLDWLAAYPDLNLRIALLYIWGKHSVGKNMLGDALTFLTESNLSVDLGEVHHDFQDNVVKTPLFWSDEQVNVPRQGGNKSLMQDVKKLTGSSAVTAKVKGKAPAVIEGNCRIYLSAQDNTLIKLDDTSNQDDFEAVRLRMVVIKAGQSARDHLTPPSITNGWSTKNIPEHIMWLNKNREILCGDRFHVEGENEESDIGRGTQSTATGVFVGALSYVLTNWHLVGAKVGHIRTTGADQGVWINGMAFYNLAMEDIFKNRPAPRRLDVLRAMGGKLLGAEDNIKWCPEKQHVVRYKKVNLQLFIQICIEEEVNFDFRAAVGDEMWLASVDRNDPRIQSTISQERTGVRARMRPVTTADVAPPAPARAASSDSHLERRF